MGRLSDAWWALIRFGFRLLYNQLAWTYDLVSRVVSLGQWRNWQRASIPHLQATPGNLILELAHGTGDLQLDLAATGLNTIGLDLSPFMGRIARHKLRRHGVDARLVHGNAKHLPFPAARFDAVVSTFPTEFIIHPDTVHEVYRVLRPGGRFVIVLNGMLAPTSLLARLMEWLYRVTGQRGTWPDPLRSFHETGFDVALITEELPGSQVIMIVAVRPAVPDGQAEVV